LSTLTPTAAHRPSTLRQLLGFAGWFAVTVVAATVGGLASVNAKNFYADLVRPDWAPPGWLFGPVWTLLYLMIAVAAFLVWRRAGWAGARLALGLFLLQLVLNAVWTWLFFGWQMGGPSFYELLLLWVSVAATLVLFWRTQRVAGALFIPYLLWVSFAGALNFSVWQMNPAILGG
jgi:tryptophan-rich sensory protein